MVLLAAEVQAILNNTELSRNKVFFSLLYGAGLRITECLRLRVKDIDFNLGCIQVQDGKGNKHRTTLLPTKLIPELQILIQQAIEIQREDNAQGVGPSLPFALDKKYPAEYRKNKRRFSPSPATVDRE